MKISKNILILIGIVSVPVMWGILQFYHLVLSRPIIEWIIQTHPQYFKSIEKPYPLVASFLNLIIFGTAAAIWPHIGFGESWKPKRIQSLFVLIFMFASVIYAVVHVVFGGVNPFKGMGFVIWTITPVQEEIIFRGFLYYLLMHIFNKSSEQSLKEVLPVILLGAIWFSLWHLSPHAIGKYGWTFMLTQLALTFIAGVIFNSMRHWTRSIWLVIPIHASGNFILSLI